MDVKYNEAAALLDGWSSQLPGGPDGDDFCEWRKWSLSKRPESSDFVTCRLTWIAEDSSVKMSVRASAICPLAAAEFAIEKFQAEYSS